MTDVELAMTRTWAEIDLDALAHNVRGLKNKLSRGTRFLGVCKANAYGHGIIPVAKKLQECGADMLATASIPEAVGLRRNGITLPVLCLGQSAPALAPFLWEQDITQAVGDIENGKALSDAAVNAGRKIRIHVKIDTGMSRIGFYWPEDSEGQKRTAGEIAALCRLPGLDAEGLFTHFAEADNEDNTTLQLDRLHEAKQALNERGVTFKIYHAAASVAMLKYPRAHLDMGRFGLSLYGYGILNGNDEEIGGVDLRPVMTVKSRISSVKRLPAGTSVSYGRTAILKRDSVLAVLPMGYADGYPRCLSNNAEVLIRGALCPVVGRVCMDMFMADVTDVPEVKAGDVAVIYDRKLMPVAARRAGTIIDEIVCRVMPRVPRVFIENGTMRVEREIEN